MPRCAGGLGLSGQGRRGALQVAGLPPDGRILVQPYGPCSRALTSCCPIPGFNRDHAASRPGAGPARGCSGGQILRVFLSLFPVAASSSWLICVPAAFKLPVWHALFSLSDGSKMHAHPLCCHSAAPSRNAELTLSLPPPRSPAHPPLPLQAIPTTSGSTAVPQTSAFPHRFQSGGTVLVAEHGSWNRQSAIGYRVALVQVGARGRAAGCSWGQSPA